VDASDDDRVVPAGVLGLDGAVDPAVDAFEDRRAEVRLAPGHPVELVGAADCEGGQIALWSVARKFTQKRPVALMRGQLVDVCATENRTSGGSRESAENA